MKKLLYLITVTLVVSVAWWKSSALVKGGQGAATTVTTTAVGTGLSQKAIDLKRAMRKLWEDHIGWTRNYIISELASLGDVEEVTKRLLQNQMDIGNAIKPYYGDAASTKLASLLKDHIIDASQVVKAAKANNKDALDAANKKWYQNADDIAAFLSSANRNWSNILKDMLHKHLDYVMGQVTSRLNKKWQDDIAFVDKNHDLMLMFADVLTEGIRQQFPDKFK